MYEHKVKKLPVTPEIKSKTGAKKSELSTTAAPSPENKPEAQASFIEIISKRIDKLLENAPRKSSAA